MAMTGPGTEIILSPNERTMAALAANEMPHIGNMNVTNSKKIHVGPKFISVNQTVENKEMIKGHVLGLELVSPATSRRLRCSVAVFLCWAFLVSSGLAFYLFYLALFKQQVRLDIDLPLPKFLWRTIKNTSTAERLACAAAIMALIVFIMLIVYYTVYVNTTESDIPVDIAPHPWNISREMWLAKPTVGNSTTDAFDPLKIVIIGHTVSNECHTFIECAAALRQLQEYFLTQLEYDIPYNFLVGNDGRVYEGRGWNREGAHTRGFNRCAVGIAFIGDYREELEAHSQYTQKQFDNVQLLFQEGTRRGHLSPDFYVVGARDVGNLPESPGSNLYNAIKQWKNFDHKHQFRNRSCEEIYGRT